MELERLFTKDVSFFTREDRRAVCSEAEKLISNPCEDSVPHAARTYGILRRYNDFAARYCTLHIRMIYTMKRLKGTYSSFASFQNLTQ